MPPSPERTSGGCANASVRRCQHHHPPCVPGHRRVPDCHCFPERSPPGIVVGPVQHGPQLGPVSVKRPVVPIVKVRQQRVADRRVANPRRRLLRLLDQKVDDRSNSERPPHTTGLPWHEFSWGRLTGVVGFLPARRPCSRPSAPASAVPRRLVGGRTASQAQGTIQHRLRIRPAALPSQAEACSSAASTACASRSSCRAVSARRSARSHSSQNPPLIASPTKARPAPPAPPPLGSADPSATTALPGPRAEPGSAVPPRTASGRRPAPRRWRSDCAAPCAGTSGRRSPGHGAPSRSAARGATGSWSITC